MIDMGYWKDVAYDMSRGMSRQDAEALNAILRSDAPEKEKRKAEAKAEAGIKLNPLP